MLKTLRKHTLAFRYAAALLSVLPIFPTRSIDTQKKQLNENALKLSPIYYSAVGLLFALILSFSYLCLASLSSNTWLNALIVLTLWTGLSGALHIDGFMDAIDALAASHRQPENTQRTLNILHEPTSGPMANCALYFLLSFKLILLHDVLVAAGDSPRFLFFILVCNFCIARYSASVYMNISRYARNKGIAIQLQEDSSTKKTIFSLAFLVIALILTLALLVAPSHNNSAFILLPAALLLIALSTYAWRKLWVNRIGGYTGDTLGALIEINETLTLLLIVLFFLS